MDEIQKQHLNDILPDLEEHHRKFIYDKIIENDIEHTKNNRGILFSDQNLPDEFAKWLYSWAVTRHSEIQFRTLPE